VKKLISILLAALLLCGCAVSNDGDTTQAASANEQTQTEEPIVTPVPGPTPVPGLTSIALPAEVAFNAGALSETETDGVYSVALPEEEEDRPNAPTYTWYINGTDADVIDEVVIEFDVFDTVRPLDGMYFGYDEAFYVILHNFETIPAQPPWPYNVEQTAGDTDQEAMLRLPELGVDLKKFASWEDKHVRIVIPYTEFQNAPKDLTLQFLPGTTFGNLTIRLLGADGLYEDEIERISQTVESPGRSPMLKELSADFREVYGVGLNQEGFHNRTAVDDMTFNQWIMKAGLVINPDGSINMPVALYDLGDYANQVQGDYAVIPEGIVSALTTLSHTDGGFFTEEDQRQVVSFILENMMNENGQFYGIYDIAQQKLVATDRKAAALPILAILCGYLSDRDVDLIANSILANDIVRVGDTLYYAPYGISEDGIMDLKLSDFVITGGLYGLFIDYSNDGSRLNEKYGCAMLMEGIANSLKLILEGQEQNATRLPSSELRVVFSGDGESYELLPSGTFSINNSFFSVGMISFECLRYSINEFKFVDDTIQNDIDWVFIRLNKVKNGAYTVQQAKAIRDLEVLYAEYSNAYTIMNTLYESWLDVYNFLRVQTSGTAYAPGYDVQTGEMIEAPADDALYSAFHELAKYRIRFGTPAVPMNYFCLVGIFNDEAMSKECVNLVQAIYYMHLMYFDSQPDQQNPDIYVDNGFNIWGYDSLIYASGGWLTAGMQTRHQYTSSGLCLSRENWRVFAMRKANQFMEDETGYLTPDDVFPTFYDDIPAVTIEN